MADKLPSFILRDCTLNVDKESQVGQTDEIALPVLEKKMEEMRNGGMIKPRMVHMGYNATTANFKFTSFDPAILALYGIDPSKEIPIIAYGFLQDEDGTEHEARAEMAGQFTKYDPGTWKTGDVAMSDTDFSVNSYRLLIDDNEIVAINDFDIRINGVSTQAGRRRALRLD